MGVRDLREWAATVARDISRGLVEVAANAAARIDLHVNAAARVSDLQRANVRLFNDLALHQERDEHRRAQLRRAETTITTLEEAVTAAENALAAETAANNTLRVLIGQIAAEHQSVLNQLVAAQANEATAVDALDRVITDDAIADTQRTNDLIAELAAAFPGTIPQVPVPAPGDPAEVPVIAAPGPEADPEPVASPDDEPTTT